MAGDRRDAGEQPQGLLDRHVEHISDGVALVVDLEGLAVVALALADLAGDVDVGQELHVDLDRAVAGAGLAAAAADVEGEPARQVAAHLGLVGGREEPPDVVEHAGVGGRVGPGCGRSATGRRRSPCPGAWPWSATGSGSARSASGTRPASAPAEHVVDQVDLPDPDTPVTQVKTPRGSRTVSPRLCSRTPTSSSQRLRLAAAGRDGERPACRPCTGRSGTPRALQVGQGALGHDLAAVLARPRADIDQVVGGADGGLVVLDHDQGVAEVAQPGPGSRSAGGCRQCSPMEGSSSTYRTSVRPEPIWVASRIRWPLPPARVADARSMLR